MNSNDLDLCDFSVSAKDTIPHEAILLEDFRLTPKGPSLVIHQNHFKTVTLRSDIIRFFQKLFYYFQPLDL